MIGFIVIISIIAVTFGAIIKETERFEPKIEAEHEKNDKIENGYEKEYIIDCASGH